MVGLPLSVLVREGARDELLDEVERDGRVLANLLEESVREEDIPALTNITDRFASRTGGRVVVVGRDGATLADTLEAPASSNVSTREEVLAALAGSQASGLRYSESFGGELGYVAVPIFSGADVVGAVRVSEPTDNMRSAVRAFWVVYLTVCAGVVAMSGIGGWFIARWATRPVGELEEGALRLANGDLAARAVVRGGPPELRRLARTFNQMATQLQLLVASQRAFVADASHQLRTPLTALRLRIESIDDRLRGDTAADSSGIERDLDAVSSEIDRLTALV